MLDTQRAERADDGVDGGDRALALELGAELGVPLSQAWPAADGDGSPPRTCSRLPIAALDYGENAE
jgi:hypothetical protein